jgi:hypothetical protein
VIKRQGSVWLLALQLGVVNHGLHKHFRTVQIDRTAFHSAEMNDRLLVPRLLVLLND